MSENPVPMKHDTPENKAIADANTVLRVQVGSGLHGVSVSDQDDRDEMGVCIEPPEYVIGLRRFEQYEYRTQQMHVRSGPGDLDLNIYSLRKWARLAADGNPTVLMLLFAPDSEIVSIAWPGYDLRARREMFLSRQAGARFVGYLERQRDRMLGKLSQRTNRPELVEKYGFDCYLDDTEFLTDRGWLTYDEVTAHDRLATVSPSTGRVVFQPYLERVAKPYTGPILMSKTRYSEWAVTPNHRMRVAKMLRGPSGVNPRAYTDQYADGWGFRPASEVTALDWYQQVAAVPFDRETVVVDDADLALIGAYVSEGCVGKRLRDGRPSVLRFEQKDGGRLHDTMALATTKYSLREYRYPDRRPVTIWTLANRTTAANISAWCGEGSANKQLPYWTLYLTPRQANLLLQSLLSGDGTPYRTGGWIYYTQSRKLAGDVQAVAVLAGRRANVRGPYDPGSMYQVLIHDPGDTPYAAFRGRDVKSVEVTDRRIVCFTVPNETLVTRRNGHVAMHGNTKFAYHAARLGVQGVELLTTGHITLPVPGPERSWLLDIRQGRIAKDAVLLAIETMRTRLVELTDGLSDLPERPDHGAINDWLVSTYTNWWDRIAWQGTVDGSGR